jgi:hypothetical protein
MDKVAVPDPPEFVAVIMYTVLGEAVVAVPEISPVAVSILKPDGSDGEIDQDVTGLIAEGVSTGEAVPSTNVFDTFA